MTARTASLEKTTALQPRNERGWRQGLANLLRKEGGLWWGTRLWWVQVLIWVGILNGAMLLPLYFMRGIFAEQGMDALAAATDMFFTFAAIAPPIGAIILAQGAVITEKQLGTAAWILSKPVSRTAFVLAKFVAYGLGILVTAIFAPGVIAYLMLSLENGALLPLLPFAAALGIVALHLLFYLALTLMLGTFFSSRGPVLAIPLGVLFAGDIILGLWPGLGSVMPWLLGRIAVLTAQGLPLPTLWPVAVTFLWLAAFVGLAIWRFRREEF
jgi:ABC-2 type transport system permease protein